MDKEGQDTEDPREVLDDGGLLYLGGSEETGGYKGYGLGMMVDVLGGILGGGLFGKNIRRWRKDTFDANLVRLSVCAVEPSNMGPAILSVIEMLLLFWSLEKLLLGL